MKPLFEIFDAEDEKLLASQEIKKNLHKIDAKDASVVVQLSSGDVKGNMFRALRPGDTELVVGVYSVNEKGNLAVLTGLGKEPVAVISTIFDIVKNCVTKNKTIETVVFRLNKRALKGKEKLLQRIIQKLIKARFGSKFETKEEFIDVSPAMSFIVAQKRNADEIDPEEFIEKQEKVKDKMVVKQLALDFGDSDPAFKLLKKYGNPTEVGENLFSLDVPGLDKTIELVVDLNPRARAKIIAKNVDKKQAMEIYKAGLEQYVTLKGTAPDVSDVYSSQFDEYILSTIIHYAKGGKVHFVGNDEEDYDYTRKRGKPSQQYTAKQGAYGTTLKGGSIKKAISDLAKSKTVDVNKLPAEDFIAPTNQKIDLKANLEKVLKTARNYSFLVDSKELKLVEVLADLTSIKDVSRELEKYLKSASGKYNVGNFVENVLEQVLLAFPQSDTLSELDKAVVSRYTNEQNNGINKNLRFGEKLNQSQQKYVDELSKVISKNSQQFDLVYRVIRDMSPYEVQDWIETNVIEDKGFVSASLAPAQFLSTYRVEGSADKQKGSIEKALDAALMNDNKFDVVLRIQDAKGVLVGDASIHKKEAEVLINKGAKFTITSIDKVIPGKTKNVIELTVTQSSNAKGGSVVAGQNSANYDVKTVRTVALKAIKEYAKEYNMKGQAKTSNRSAQYFNGTTLESGTKVAAYKNKGSYSGWAKPYHVSTKIEEVGAAAIKVVSALKAKSIDADLTEQNGTYFIETANCVVVVGRTVANSHPNVWPHILAAYLYNKDTDVSSLLSKDDNDGVVTESKPRNLFDIAKTILEQNS